MFDVEKIRADFPLLSTEVYGRPLVYLDSGATAQKPRCVIDTVDYLHRELNANIHRGVHRLAEEATERYEAARDRIRAFIGAAHREEVIFTAGATASLNTVAYAWGDTFLRAGDNIVVSEMEHHSNLVPWQAVALRKGAELRMLPFDDAGRLMTERLDGLIDGRTRMVAVTQASNTLGTRPDLRPIVEAAARRGRIGVRGRMPGHRSRRRGCRGAGVRLLCLFGTQALRPDRYRRALRAARTARCDASVPLRRRYGGSGVVRGTTYAPLPLKFEAGTANFVGAIGLGEAIRYLEQFDPAEIEAYERELLGYAAERLSAVDGLRIYGATPDKCAIVSFTVEGTHPYDVGMILDKLGIAVRTGQHCAEPVMTHYGVPGMCRASLAMYNTRGEIDALAAGVERAVRMLR